MFKRFNLKNITLLLALIFITTAIAAITIYFIQYASNGVSFADLQPANPKVAAPGTENSLNSPTANKEDSKASMDIKSDTTLRSSDEALSAASHAVDKALSDASDAIDKALSTASNAVNVSSSAASDAVGLVLSVASDVSDAAGAIAAKDTNLAAGIAVDEEKSELLQGIKFISVIGVSEDIRFATEKSDKIGIHFHGSYVSSNPKYRPELSVDRSGNSLRIEIKYTPDTPVVNFRSNLKLDISLPEKFTGIMELLSVSGDIVSDKMTLDSLHCTTVSGDINFKQVTSKKADIAATSGDTILNGTFDEFKFESVSGNFESRNLSSKSSRLDSSSGEIKVAGNPGDVDSSLISGSLVLEYNTFSNRIKTHAISGDISVKVPESSGFQLDYTTVSGDVDCVFPVAFSGKKTEKGLKGLVGNGKGFLSVNTVSGDLRITN
jgi:lia operon protein LiaG